jgi:hypothetical protein
MKEHARNYASQSAWRKAMTLGPIRVYKTPWYKSEKIDKPLLKKRWEENFIEKNSGADENNEPYHPRKVAGPVYIAKRNHSEGVRPFSCPANNRKYTMGA